jgi:probable rRNA maturation factor
MSADDASNSNDRPLRVSTCDARGRRLRTGLGHWLAAVAPSSARGNVCIALLPDARVRALNRQFRRKDSATDVLSFPAGSDTEPKPLRASRPYPIRHLGDIVIARGVARRQARAAGHSDSTELRVRALHGLLHLLGYDHETDSGNMARLERRLRRKGGLREGLIER